jgi:hypothetical protein
MLTVMNYAAWGLCVLFVVLFVIDIVKTEKAGKKQT